MSETAEIFRREVNLNLDPTQPPRNTFSPPNLWFYSLWSVVGAYLHVGLSFFSSDYWFYSFLCVLFMYKFIGIRSFFMIREELLCCNFFHFV